MTKSSEALVKGNNLIENLHRGIKIQCVNTKPTIERNRCESNKENGIHISGGARPVVIKNVCIRNNNSGIDIGGTGTSPIVQNNRCEENIASSGN